MSDNFNKNRLAKNTIFLYVRMLFTMWLNLWATRLVLQNLGVEDMGVYGVVGSITTLFTVFVGGITSAVQRYMTFELGIKDGHPNLVFCSSLNVIFIVSGILFVLLESGGIWFLYNKVNIPAASMDAAFWVFQLSIAACIVNIIAIPYNALVIAHEKMNAFATISIIQVVLTWLAAYFLSLFDSGKLVIYAVAIAAVTVAIRFIYQIYCHVKFEESRYHFIIDKELIRSMTKFMGLTTISNILQLIAYQGIIFVINLTLDVALNAVYAIATQLRNMVLSFAQNVQRAIAPQITKTYASGDMGHHLKLVYGGSKLQVYMIYFILIPFMFRTDYITSLWLGDVPEHTAMFTRCSILASLAYAMLEPIRTSVNATNRIGKFMLVPDTFFLLVLPVAYCVSRRTGSADKMMISVITMELLSVILRIWYASKVGTIRLADVIQFVYLPCALVGLAGILSGYLIDITLPNNILGMVGFLVLNGVILLVCILMFGLSMSEKFFVKGLWLRIRKRMCKV